MAAIGTTFGHHDAGAEFPSTAAQAHSPKPPAVVSHPTARRAPSVPRILCPKPTPKVRVFAKRTQLLSLNTGFFKNATLELTPLCDRRSEVGHFVHVTLEALSMSSIRPTAALRSHGMASMRRAGPCRCRRRLLRSMNGGRFGRGRSGVAYANSFQGPGEDFGGDGGAGGLFPAGADSLLALQQQLMADRRADGVEGLDALLPDFGELEQIKSARGFNHLADLIRPAQGEQRLDNRRIKPGVTLAGLNPPDVAAAIAGGLVVRIFGGQRTESAQGAGGRDGGGLLARFDEPLLEAGPGFGRHLRRGLREQNRAAAHGRFDVLGAVGRVVGLDLVRSGFRIGEARLQLHLAELHDKEVFPGASHLRGLVEPGGLGGLDEGGVIEQFLQQGGLLARVVADGARLHRGFEFGLPDFTRSDAGHQIVFPRGPLGASELEGDYEHAGGNSRENAGAMDGATHGLSEAGA